MNAFEKEKTFDEENLFKKNFWGARIFLGCLGRWTFDEWQVQAPEIRGSRKGWFCDLEPTQTFRCLTAVFNLSFERQGTYWKSCSIFWCICNLVFLIRLCCLSATKWPQITYSNRTNTTMSPTILEIKWSNVEDITIFSSFGSCGEQR